ncbi:hypothetical protein IDH44_03365 [Paenibacillus sp. IB182496]|uniref:RsgI N-terminal anti-sigma domain-containing protein n=1 Tax=Paenibacillus sabuli TaxID=2772509 RepID=A0A927GQF2_9BACL|nr:anti-sigma factor domain-containing protein [Paenibacillus sabuli]MBD2844216.1 hypothetical protein [Paenibacillus sabuli]
MKRGIVMETAVDHVIVLTSEGQFRRVNGRFAVSVGEELELSSALRRGPRRLRWAAALVAAVVLLAMLPRWLMPAQEVALYLTLDVNPSVELGIDQQGRVRELKAWNTDGDAVIAGLHYRAAPLERVLGEVMQRIRERSELPPGTVDLLLTSVPAAGVTDRLEQALLEQAKRSVSTAWTASGQSLRVAVLRAPPEVRAEASRLALTPGKLSVYLLAASEGLELELETLRDASLGAAAEAGGGVQRLLAEGGLDGHAGAADRELLERLLEERPPLPDRSPAETPPSTAQRDLEREMMMAEEAERPPEQTEEREEEHEPDSAGGGPDKSGQNRSGEAQEQRHSADDDRSRPDDAESADKGAQSASGTGQDQEPGTDKKPESGAPARSGGAPAGEDRGHADAGGTPPGRASDEHSGQASDERKARPGRGGEQGGDEFQDEQGAKGRDDGARGTNHQHGAKHGQGYRHAEKEEQTDKRGPGRADGQERRGEDESHRKDELKPRDKDESLRKPGGGDRSGADSASGKRDAPGKHE